MHRDAFYFCKTAKMLAPWGMHLAAFTHLNPCRIAVEAVQMQTRLSKHLGMSAFGVSLRPAGLSDAVPFRSPPKALPCVWKAF